MSPKAATESSSGPKRPATNMETVWIEFCKIYERITEELINLMVSFSGFRAKEFDAHRESNPRTRMRKV